MSGWAASKWAQIPASRARAKSPARLRGRDGGRAPDLQRRNLAPMEMGRQARGPPRPENPAGGHRRRSLFQEIVEPPSRRRLARTPALAQALGPIGRLRLQPPSSSRSLAAAGPARRRLGAGDGGAGCGRSASARQNGVKTRNGRPSALRIDPGSASSAPAKLALRRPAGAASSRFARRARGPGLVDAAPLDGGGAGLLDETHERGRGLPAP